MASKLPLFLKELKRRKVYRVATVYVLAGAGIIGLCEAALPSNVWEGIQIPVGIIVLIGLPIALILAWAYELKPEQGREMVRTGRRAIPMREAEEPIHSLAVLPLANLSGDPKEDYFAEGMTEALITDLARLDVVDVISRTSVMRYKNTDVPLPSIAKELGVDAVVEGSVLRVANEFRITAQLIRGDSDTHLWAGSYDRKLENILALQRDVTRAIAEEIRGRLTPKQETRLVKSREVDPKAHLSYLKGKHFRNQWTSEGFLKSIEFFTEAATVDPGYAPAYADIALTYCWWGFPATVGMPPTEAVRLGKLAALKALELDACVAEAHTALAMVSFSTDWDWEEADRRFEISLSLNPNSFFTLHFYSHFLVAMGRMDESLAISQRALTLNPLDVEMNVHMGWHHQMARQYQQALDEAQKALAVDPGFHEVYWVLGLAYEGLGRFPEALLALEKATEMSGQIPFIHAALGHAYAAAGRPADSQAVLSSLRDASGLRYVSDFNIALILAGLGELDDAFTSLEVAFEERDARLPYLATEPRFDPLRPDPRYVELLNRMGFSGVA